MSICVTTKPSAIPYQCKLCGGSANTKEWFLDTGSYEEFFGAIYYCNECFGYMAQVAGFEKVRLYDSNIGDTRLDPTVSVAGSSVLLDDPEQDYGKPSEGTVELDSGEGEVTESFYDEGMDELRSTDLASQLKLTF